MNLATAFQQAVARAPDHVAIAEAGRRLTWKAWAEEVSAVAGGLDRMGLTQGDRLVAVLSNRIETATLYWACQMLGLVFTPFNWRATAEEISYVLGDAEAKAVALEDRSRAPAMAAVAAAESVAPTVIDLDGGDGTTPFASLAATAPIETVAPVTDDAIALMLYTSGTTGRPKGVPRSHAAERAAAISCIGHLGYRFNECQLGVMPFFHTMGMRTLLMSCFLNGKLVCLPTFDVDTALDAMESEHVSALFLVPTLFHDIVQSPGIESRNLKHVRNIGYAGMSMTSALTARCVDVFKPDAFTNFYGSSEIYTFSVCDHVADKPGCAGRAGVGQEIRVVRADPEPVVGPDDRVGPGEDGEIIATMASPEAFSGYWKRPDADAKAIRDGWYFTGDLGYFDEDGELYVVGRVDDMIISGGENIHPEEVENVLAKSPLVRQAAVVGLPDARWGEAVTAFVEPANPDVETDALDAHFLASGLARFKRPRTYIFVTEIPRSASGKLLRRKLRDGEYDRLPIGGQTS